MTRSSGDQAPTAFTHVQPAVRIVFGAGTFERLADELDDRRWLIVHGGSEGRRRAARRAPRRALPPFGEVRRHVPAELADRGRGSPSSAATAWWRSAAAR